MTIQMCQLFIYTSSPPTSLRHFVEFWAERYHWPNHRLYAQIITAPHTAEKLGQLFKWKIGNRLFASKLPVLKKCFMDRDAEAEKLVKQLALREPRDIARHFLDHFKDGARFTGSSGSTVGTLDFRSMTSMFTGP
jgi:hypothetical protein